ncbi:aspartate-semialdehyde dehydrogenase [Granulicella aggregans]|uniref:Aspartate-semialdehyde dehydrogenase n=1 Tax=Granulicella aggregans TaxID=474949 RepID=A0A7W7ZGK0_9BACT|nr:Asd/ArgC dimerization domain-containing protein [Granulicella aggregans]MBB5059529.1 aspartate-semialdehyde dehydrogenase [Granulicella aggregans]
MSNKIYRIAIVGAASLAGKELGDALSDSTFAASSFTLLDEDGATGKLASAGDEISFIQPIDGNSFDAMDFVFFAGEAEVATKYWQTARKAGAGTVDMTFALEEEPGVFVRSPWVSASRELDLETSVVVAAHPAAVILGLVTARASAKFKVTGLSATVLEPASQYGRVAMDELHQQTVSLLSFQKLPRDVYDAQVAFNLLKTMGEEAKVKLAGTESRIQSHFHALLGDAPPLALQLIHAPVFHGYVISIFIELAEPTTLEAFELSLVGEHIDLLSKDSEPPSNLSATGQEEVMVTVEAADASQAENTRFKLLVAADNLKLAALHAIACARELAQLRPLGKVQ